MKKVCIVFIVYCLAISQAHGVIRDPQDFWRAQELENTIWKNQQEANRILTPSISDQLFGDGASGMATRRQYASPQFGNIINAQNELDAIHRRNNEAIQWHVPTWTPVPLPSSSPYNHEF